MLAVAAGSAVAWVPHPGLAEGALPVQAEDPLVEEGQGPESRGPEGLVPNLPPDTLPDPGVRPQRELRPPRPPAPEPGAKREPETEAQLLAELADPATKDWARVQSDLLREWSKSGSAAMDLLLQRGQDAMQAGDLPTAIEHLTALTDHAPEFAEGFNARATAYYMSGAFGPSLEDIRRTLALNPDHFAALAGLGMILQEVDRPDQAMAAFRASLKINPHQPDVAKALEQLETEHQGTEL